MSRISTLLQTFQTCIIRIQRTTGLSELFALLLFWGIIFYAILFLCIIPRYKYLRKKKIRFQQELIAHIDEMIYVLAKAQHTKQIDLKTLGGNPHIALMKSIFNKGNCDYIQSAFLILDNMHKVETLLGEKIVPIEKETIFLKKLKQYHRISFWKRLVKYFLNGATLGIYILVE